MRAERWEKNTEVPLLVLAAVFLASYTWQVLDYENRDTWQLLEAVNIAIWVVFAIDYGVRLLLTRERTSWFFRNFFDFIIIVLPALRPLRLLRLVTLLSVVNRSVGGAVRAKILIFAVGATVLLVYIASLAVLDAERAEGQITTLSEALWWAVVTITTVGYGDYAPISGTGRAVAVGLMIGGVVLVGVIVGTLSSWIVEKISDDVEQATLDQAKQLQLLHEEIQHLRHAIEENGGGSKKPPPMS
jgi:voltage-gated potassium channel